MLAPNPWTMVLHLHRRGGESPTPDAGEVPSFGAHHVAPSRALLTEFMNYAPTPLRRLPHLTRELGLDAISVKDEGERMGLGSFKALGGAHAVLCHVRRQRAVDAQASLTVTCASAGNHGISVAAGARAAGVRSVVCLSESVPRSFEARLHALGAETIRGGKDYDESLRLVEALAKEKGWAVISDTLPPALARRAPASKEHETAPREVMQAYTVLFDEAVAEHEARIGAATHVFVQAGVGGLAAAGASYLHERWPDAKFVVVEPETSACLLESIRCGEPSRVAAGKTILGRLDCSEPSDIAFRVLAHRAHAFMAITDAAAEQTVLAFARDGVVQSPCGAAGGAGLIAACRDEAARSALGLGPSSRVLLIGTEAPLS